MASTSKNRSSLSKASEAAGVSAPEKRRTLAPAKLACAECRRLKLKCSRTWPCTTCLKRGCGSVCPEGELTGGWKHARENLMSRVEQLEAALAANGIPLPPLDGVNESTQPQSPTARTEETTMNEPKAPPISIDEASNEPPPLWQSFGTLSLGGDGNARYTGPSAGSLWIHALKNKSPQEDSGDLPPDSEDELLLHPDVFRQLLAELPPLSTTLSLIDIYYAHYAWMYLIVTRAKVDIYLNALYSEDVDGAYPPHPHQLAVIFFILAVATLFNVEQSEREAAASASKWHNLGRTTLAHSKFLTHNTLASLQALHILSAYLHNSYQGGGSDSYWPILGMGMRLVQAMGLHRDGSGWGIEGRNLKSEGVYFGNGIRLTLSRVFALVAQIVRYAMPARHMDCKPPTDAMPDAWGPSGSSSGFPAWKYQLCSILNLINDEVFSVRAPDYGAVLKLDGDICEFRSTTPPQLSCAAAMQGVKTPTITEPSFYIPQSPQVLAYEQHTLACNINEALLFLHRGFFARALQGEAGGVNGRFEPSVIAITDSCQNLISILKSMVSVNQIITMRHYFFWFHAFGASVCMAALIIRAPTSPLAAPAWKSLTTACEIFSSLPEDARARRPLPVLAQLYQRSYTALNSRIGAALQGEGLDDQVLMDILGSSTRLLQKPVYRPVNIVPSVPPRTTAQNPVKSDDISMLFSLPNDPITMANPVQQPHSRNRAAPDYFSEEFLLNDAGNVSSWLVPGPGPTEWGSFIDSLGIEFITGPGGPSSGGNFQDPNAANAQFNPRL